MPSLPSSQDPGNEGQPSGGGGSIFNGGSSIGGDQSAFGEPIAGSSINNPAANTPFFPVDISQQQQNILSKIPAQYRNKNLLEFFNPAILSNPSVAEALKEIQALPQTTAHHRVPNRDHLFKRPSARHYQTTGNHGVLFPDEDGSFNPPITDNPWKDMAEHLLHENRSKQARIDRMVERELNKCRKKEKKKSRSTKQKQHLERVHARTRQIWGEVKKANQQNTEPMCVVDKPNWHNARLGHIPYLRDPNNPFKPTKDIR